MKHIHPLIRGVVFLAIGIFGLLIAGCSNSQDGGTPSQLGDCAKWQKIVAMYDAVVASGHVQSEDEKRAMLTAKTMLLVACGNAKLVIPKGIAAPPQPEFVSCNGFTYRRSMEWHLIQDPTGVFDRAIDYGLATVSIGAFYVLDSDDPKNPCTYMLPLAYERGLTDEVTHMVPVGCW